MAVPRKLVVVPNDPTRELWRIAETGEIGELEEVLRLADVNARNEHGMTALMRAAYHGRVLMVRLLLEHGADPNVARNDNFTALSLAAFFGHAEIVDILVGHGAKTDVATRFGTSPYIWAKARSFGDVARSLENKKPITPVRAAEPKPEPAAIVVRTLKDPPEIWDLVQEAPRKFDARTAFVARMGSLKAGLVMAVVLLAVIGAGAGAASYFKNRAAATATVSAPAVNQPMVNQTRDTINVLPKTQPLATEPINTELNANPNLTNTITRRSRSFPKHRDVPNEVNNEQTTVETAVRSQVARPPVVDVKPEAGSSATVNTKTSTPPSNSQMISPPKTTQPKAKVIQWP